MAFWVRNTTGGNVTVDDLGCTLAAAEERDLHVHFLFDILQMSADLVTALGSGDLVRIDGPGGSTIPAAEAFDDATSEHKLGGAAHTSTSLAGLNALLTDASLDDSSAQRPPTAHASTHKGGGADQIDLASPTVAGLLSSSDKAKLNDLSAGGLYLACRNETGSDIPIGKLVAAAGWDPVNALPLIKIADKDTAGARPAIGYTETAIVNNTNGRIITTGHVFNIDTSTWAVSDQLVLGNTGGFLLPPPGVDPFTGDVQNVAVVVTSHATDGILLLTPTGSPPLTSAQIFALIGSDGSPSKTNPYVTDSDARLELPEHNFRVSPSGGDYTSIKDAIDAAITAGAALGNPYQITVFPGVYTEAPMTMQQGITVTTVSRSDAVIVQASDSAEDLFTCTGGNITGVTCGGVTDAAKALFRCSTASTLTVLHGVSVRECSTGIAVSNGAAVIGTDFSVDINTTGIEVGTAISVTGAGSYFAVVGGFFSVPSALLPAYSVNPIQTALRVADQAEVYLVGVTARIANKDTTPDTLLADGGSKTTVMASEISNCYRAARIGSAGTGTTVIVQGGAMFGNTINGQCDSATGVFLVNAATDSFKWSAVAGAVLSGSVQSTDDDRTYLAGLLSYWFTTGKVMTLEKWFHDQTSTGVAWPYDTLVTDGGGLNVDIAAADGWVTRHAPDHDSFNVEWEADTVALTASTTNYVGYDSTTSLLAATTSYPGNEFVLLATVITDGSGIRFIHRTRALAHDVQARMQEYLEITRKILLKTGLSTVAGSTVVKFEVQSGEWYRSIDIIPYTGTGTDAAFSYFYGSNGATEVTGQTSVDTVYYDASGTLTAMTASYYRSDTVVLTSDGRISVIYGTAEFATELLAIATSLGSVPTFMEATGITLARLIVQQGNGITTIVDERPVGEVSGGSGQTIAVHANLAGLSADDHTQYLLASGTRPMAGDLNMGSNNIGTVGTVDGVTVSAHAGRHAPGAADALTTYTPVTTQVGATAAEGTAASLARSDHQHGITAGTPVAVGTANAAGSASSAARGDHVHAGLTRGANDFNSFTVKAAPTSSDILLIEDAAAANAKKKITIGTLPAAVDTTAIHKATSAEISAMTEKTTPVGADVVVIEDSAASYSKKKVQVTNLLAQKVFGNNFQYGESLGESTTTAAWTQKLRMTTPSLPAGTYRIGWSCELRCRSSISADVLVRVQVDDSTTLASGNVESKDTRTYYPFGGTSYYVLGTGAALNIDMDFGSEGGKTAVIRNARLEIWRVV